MKDFKKYTILILLMFLPVCMLAQEGNPIDVSKLSARKLKSYGKNADRLGDVYSAVDFLEPYCKLKPKDAAMNFRLGELYFASRDYEKAADQFAKVAKEWVEDYPEAFYFQAMSLKSMGKYPEAREAFVKFQRRLKRVKKNPTTSAALRLEIASCDSAAGITKKPLKMVIDHMGSSINGGHQELSPMPVDENEMIYSSLKTETEYFYRDDTSALPVRQFYIAKKSGLDWTGGKTFEGPVNIPGIETGNGAFSRDGKRFYFTRCGTSMGRMHCAIYVTTRAGDSWSEPMELNSLINDLNYTATQPAIGYTAQSNLEVLYFISDRPGGRGGKDIWYSIYDPRKKEFRQPRNAGSKINTAGDEMTPFYDHSTRTLYFSSNGYQGLGGFDIYKSMGELRKWGDIQNGGYPLNSSYDDLYFSISKNREDGFLVSNRPSQNSFRNPSCCDDIYQYRWTDFVRVAVKGTVYPAEAAKMGKNLDQEQLLAMKDSIKPLSKAVLSLYMLDKKTKDKVFIDRDTTDDTGGYFFDLQPDKDYKFEMEGAQYFNEQINISTEGVNFTYTIEMPPIWVNILNDKPIVLKNVYYGFDEFELSPIAKKSIDSTLYELMLKATDIIVEVGSHTDSVGNFDYNMKLSQKRADEVVKYLLSKGISKKRLVAKGYGASKPVAPNYNPDKTDNPDGREKNRRTEFRVVGTLSSQIDDVDTDETQ